MGANKRAGTWVGVDVGGTKILAAAVTDSGEILARSRQSTPRGKEPSAIVKAVVEAINEAAEGAGIEASDLAAVGVAVPGVVDPEAGRVIVTPNTNLSGVSMSDEIRAAIDVPAALGNDVNLGTLGEKWLGSAHDASSAVGIFVGTGIGGGFFANGQLQRGFGGGAGEVGHMIMQLDGPKCGCGNRGCFEALASRTAIERDIRAAIDAGRKSVVPDLLKEKSSTLIRSGILKQALADEDKLVTEVLKRASETIGYACRSICHLVEPEVFVLGGGVVEACWDFMLPIIEEVVESDPFSGDRPGGRVLLSALGDDAVALGAVALAQQRAGLDPFKVVAVAATQCAAIRPADSGFMVGRDVYEHEIYVRADCEVVRPRKSVAKKVSESGKGKIGQKVLERICIGSPAVLFLPGGDDGIKLSSKGEAFLHFRGVEARILPKADVLEAYNACRRRKAILLPSSVE